MSCSGGLHTAVLDTDDTEFLVLVVPRWLLAAELTVGVSSRAGGASLKGWGRGEE